MSAESIELTIIPVEPTTWDGKDRVDPGQYHFNAHERNLIAQIVSCHAQLPALRPIVETRAEAGVFSIGSSNYGEDVTAFFDLISDLSGQVDYTASPVRMWLAQPNFFTRVEFSQLRIVLVWLTRGERFCDGFWAEQFHNGTVSKLIRRLANLAADKGTERITMFKIAENKLSLTPIPKTTLVEVNILERQNLQKLIKSSFADVADAMNEDRLILIGEEVLPSLVVSDRIDLLAVDDYDGTIVVIELKRAKHKLQLLQALSYAAMISGSQGSELRKLQGVDGKAVDGLQVNELKDRPRLILVAEDFDYQVLKTAQWLGTQSIQVKCVKVSVSEDKEVNHRFLSFSVIFPPRAIEEEAKLKHLRKDGAPSGDWEEFVNQIKNEALKRFVQSNLSNARENQFAYKTFHFRIQGSRRFQVWIRLTSALVEQIGRFENDWSFWKARLSPEAEVELREVYGGDRLRFELNSAENFLTFDKAETDLNNKIWKTKLADLDGGHSS